LDVPSIRAIPTRDHLSVPAIPRSRRRRHEDQGRLGRVEQSDLDDLARPLESVELRRIIRQALESLAPDHRSVLILADVEQKDYPSIAASLGIPIGNPSVRVPTVRGKLSARSW
jgi:DNA-directed RNA polymerase specialized sigma24 family protein